MDIVKIAEIGKETGLKGKKLDNFIVFLILDLIILQNLIVKRANRFKEDDPRVFMDSKSKFIYSIIDEDSK